MSGPVIIDGALRADGRIEVDVLGGALHQGAGLFETVFLDAERRLHAADRHVQRLRASSAALGLGAAPTADEWRADTRLLVPQLDPGAHALRWLWMQDGPDLRRAVAATPLAPGPAVMRMSLLPAGDARGRSLPRHKTFNWLGPRLGLQDAAPETEPIFRDAQGRLLEGARSNFFVVQAGSLVTPPVDAGLLPGVGRALVIDLAEHEGIPVRFQGIDPDGISDWDEAFLVSSLRGVRPVSHAEQTPISLAGTLTTRFARAFRLRSEQESWALAQQ